MRLEKIGLSGDYAFVEVKIRVKIRGHMIAHRTPLSPMTIGGAVAFGNLEGSRCRWPGTRS